MPEARLRVVERDRHQFLEKVRIYGPRGDHGTHRQRCDCQALGYLEHIRQRFLFVAVAPVFNTFIDLTQ
ncbi:hypothetical protein D3C75_1082010 [compost metagenome]